MLGRHPSRLGDRFDHLSTDELAEVDRALQVVMGLEP